MAKKLYNPFNMVGSYIGALILVIYYVFSTEYFWFDMRDILLKLGFSLSSKTGGHITALFLTILTGFLIGYGIHSLIRKLRK